MIRNQSVEEISDGHFYRAQDMVRLGNGDCAGCHECCSMGPVIYLDPYDAFFMEKGLGVPFSALIGQRVELQLADGLILPALKLRKSMDKDKKAITDEETECTFLGADGRCSIHSFRPGICRLYPLGRSWEGDEFCYILQKGECSRSNGSKVRIRKWLGIADLGAYEEFCREWHALLGKARSCADMAGESSDSASLLMRRQICMKLLETFFTDPWKTDEDFYSQFRARRISCLKSLGYAV